MTLVQRQQQQRLWAPPLILTLLVSWCTLLCLPGVHASTPSAPATQSVVVLDCHGLPVTIEVTAASGQAPDHNPSDCPDCNPVYLDNAAQTQLQAATLSQWLTSLPLALDSARQAFLPPPPIPPPRQRLHLLKSVFLI